MHGPQCMVFWYTMLMRFLLEIYVKKDDNSMHLLWFRLNDYDQETEQWQRQQIPIRTAGNYQVW